MITEVTAVKVWLPKKVVGRGHLKCFAKVILNNDFCVNGLKLIEKSNGSRFVAMPEHEKGNGDIVEVCNPVNKHMRAKIEDAIMEEYQAELKRAEAL